MEEIIWQRDFIHDSDEFYSNLTTNNTNNNRNKRAILIDDDDDGGDAENRPDWKCQRAFHSCLEKFTRFSLKSGDESEIHNRENITKPNKEAPDLNNRIVSCMPAAVAQNANDAATAMTQRRLLKLDEKEKSALLGNMSAFRLPTSSVHLRPPSLPSSQIDLSFDSLSSSSSIETDKVMKDLGVRLSQISSSSE